MPKAIWNGAVIAEADAADVKIVENNVYFPRAAVHAEYLRDSAHHSKCPWKGLASYYSLAVAGDVNENAAWYYPEPSDAAGEIKDHIAFWRGVEVQR
jgi:uncharacterized protein (DUF427 family)